MNSSRRRIASLALAIVAAGLLGLALKLPLWHLRMEAPQYQNEEALHVHVFAGAMTGDLREITVLNQYIGVHIPLVLPQSKWLPQALLFGAALGVAAGLLPRNARGTAMALVPIALAVSIGFAVFQAKHQMHDIGHKRDSHTKLARVRDFDPPFLGSVKIAQFTVTSWFGPGAFCLGIALALQAGAVVLSRSAVRTASRAGRLGPAASTQALAALL